MLRPPPPRDAMDAPDDAFPSSLVSLDARSRSRASFISDCIASSPMGLRSGASSRRTSPTGRRATAVSPEGLSTADLKRELRRREGPKPHEAAAEAAEEAANATQLRKVAFGSFDNAIAAQLKLQSEQLLLKLGRDEADVGGANGEMKRVVLSVFESLSRVVLEAGHELQDAEKSVARVELKAQHSALTSKLETSRSAAAVNLNATKMEMDAAATKMLDEKVEQMREGDVQELERTKAELLDLGDAHNALVMAHKLSEDALKTAIQGQRSTTREMEAAAKQHAELKRDAAAAKKALDEALQLAARVPNAVSTKEARQQAPQAAGSAPVSTQTVEGATTHARDTFGGFRKLLAKRAPSRAAGDLMSVGIDAVNNEERSLADRVSAIVAALEAACGQRDSATASLEEALHEAEHAAMMHAEECKRLAEALAAKVREDVVPARHDKLEAAEADGREREAAEPDGELTRTAEVEELGATLGTSSSSDLTGENKRLRAEVARLASETEDARKQVDAILSKLNFAIDEKKSLGEAMQELVERYERTETEIRATKATLDETLSKLGWTRDENASLSVHVKQLVDQYGAACDELAKSKRDVAEALVSLGVQADTNRALDEQVASLLEKLSELAIEADKGRALSREVEDIRTRLQSGLPKVSALTSTKLSLCDQVDELMDKHGVALERIGALEKQYHELVQSSKAFEVRVMTHAESMVYKVKDEARFKRAELVEAALSSLNELRFHLTHTPSGQSDDAFHPTGSRASPRDVMHTFTRPAAPGRWGRSLQTPTKLERLVVRRPDLGDLTAASMPLATLPPPSSPSKVRARSQELPSPPQNSAPSSQSVTSPRGQRARASAQHAPRPSTAPEPCLLSPPASTRDAFNMGYNPKYRLSPSPEPRLSPSPEPTGLDLGLPGGEP